MRLFGYAPQNGAAAGDTMPFWHEGRWHLFFSQPPLGAWEYVERARVSTAHLVSDDLVNWEVLPDSFGPGPDGSCDGNGIWTGSVIEHEGVFHFFYTGYNRHADSPQSICKAVSTDLVHWEKVADNPLFGPDPRWYETVDWRDPFVYRDEEQGCFMMLISARLKEGPLYRRGCIAVAVSDDLEHWEVREPYTAPLLTHCPECPELFQLGDWWYLVRSRYDGQAQTFYRVAPTPQGPWRARRLETLDGRRFYAAKSAGDGRRRFSFAWIPYRKHHEARGDWVWGGQLGSPHELLSLADGTLITRLPPEVAASYGESLTWDCGTQLGDWQREGADLVCDAGDSYAWCALDVDPGDEVLLDTTIEIAAGTTAAGVLLEIQGTELEAGYYLGIEPLQERAVLDRWPTPMDPLWDSLVLGERHGVQVRQEIDAPLVVRPLAFTPSDGRYRLQLLRKGGLVECYVAEQVVASYRIYERGDCAFGLFVQEGAARFVEPRFLR